MIGFSIGSEIEHVGRRSVVCFVAILELSSFQALDRPACAATVASARNLTAIRRDFLVATDIS
jgi:hypothetical protein